MIRNWLLFGTALAIGCGALADGSGPARPVRVAFANAPRASVEALGSSAGRPVTNGLVFISGYYQSPPYVVSRVGTVLRVNGHGVTDEVVPWSEFVLALASEETDDVSSAVGAAESATNATSVAEAKSPEVAAERKPPELNEAAKALLAKIDAERARFEALLAGGGYLCFAPGRSVSSGASNECRQVLMTLPDAMRTHADYSDFAAAVRAGGLDGIPEGTLRDWHARRRQYPRLEERRWIFRRLERGRPLTVD